MQVKELKAFFFFFLKWWGCQEISSTGWLLESCLQTDQFSALEPILLPLLGCDLAVSGGSENHSVRGYEFNIKSTFHWISAPFHYCHWSGLVFFCFGVFFPPILLELMREFVGNHKGHAPETRSTKPPLSHMQDGCMGSWEIQSGPEFK